MTDKELFDAIRARKGAPLTKADVDAINAIIGVATDTPSDAITLIKRFEGCKLAAYPDPGTGGDPWTIGWGATGPGIRKGVVWTQAQADERLAQDVAKFASDARDALGGSPATEKQFSAMVSLAYNIGSGALRSSTLLKKHKAGDYAGAADEFPRWNKAGGKVLKGLVNRRAAERAVYLGGAA